VAVRIVGLLAGRRLAVAGLTLRLLPVLARLAVRRLLRVSGLAVGLLGLLAVLPRLAVARLLPVLLPVLLRVVWLVQ
jgi:hypothetical protein